MRGESEKATPRESRRREKSGGVVLNCARTSLYAHLQQTLWLNENSLLFLLQQFFALLQSAVFVSLEMQMN